MAKTTKILSTDLLHFDQLSKEQLYDILQFRADVLVLEQAAFYQDIDGKDQKAWHVLINGESRVLGNLRIRKDHNDPSRFTIDRVAVAKAARGKGLARELMERAHEFIAKQTGAETIELSVQEQLAQFYQSLGYVLISDEAYDEAGVKHLDMIRAV